MLSDLYAMGVVRCHNMLMLLGVSKEFTDQERDVVVPLLMKGFQVYYIIYYMLLSSFFTHSPKFFPCLLPTSFSCAIMFTGYSQRGRLLSNWRSNSGQSLVHHWWSCVKCLLYG